MSHDAHHSSRRRNRNRLRYKETRTGAGPTRNLRQSRSPQSHRAESTYLPVNSDVPTQQQPHGLDPDDEAFYGSGAAFQTEASLAADYVEDDFTERLFDALADDEGKEYWHQVYGQPIHDLPAEEQMTDDEYAAFVRRSMWSRSHGRQEGSDDRQEHDKRRRRTQHAQFLSEQQESERQRLATLTKKSLQERWKVYLKAWSDLGQVEWTLPTIPWPIASGKYSDLTRVNVEQFLGFAGSPAIMAREELRRRWHPDRFQQRSQRHVREQDRVSSLSTVTLVAQLLNEIIAS